LIHDLLASARALAGTVNLPPSGMTRDLRQE
jgi:hypothetical protein